MYLLNIFLFISLYNYYYPSNCRIGLLVILPINSPASPNFAEMARPVLWSLIISPVSSSTLAKKYGSNLNAHTGKNPQAPTCPTTFTEIKLKNTYSVLMHTKT